MMKPDEGGGGSRPQKADQAGSSGGFICGVVEGFYGRPWTTEQRKDLFAKMKSWGMTSYLYAPKDDCKHRAYWRELYTVEEADHLQSLIALAKECDIDFYYAISPGLDITYSSTKEMACLKRKLEQVDQLGCKSFALLFDDIEPEMCKQDKEVFQSFAHAQVTVTNDIYEHFSRPNFLFCPTQYCTARAVPTIRNSEYLTTLGSKLAPGINIMWTGDKVISKYITFKCLEDINDVLQRPVVIWDNEHANDYDQKRVFLGPYSGRSPELISKLNGVMTNPNCEYGANFVGIHTLAQWSHCKIDGTRPHSEASETISADIKLEIQSSDDSSDWLSPAPLPPEVYHPKNALIAAVTEWLPEFSRQKTVWGPMSKPQVGLTAPTLVPSVATCMSTTGTTELVNSLSQVAKNPAEAAGNPDSANQEALNGISSSPIGGPPSTTSGSTNSLATPCPLDSNTSSLQPISLPVMNSLMTTNKVVVDQNIITASQEQADQVSTDGVVTTQASVQPSTTVAQMVAAATAVVESASTATASTTIVPNAPIPNNVIPGPTYLEPMDCNPGGDDEGAHAAGTDKSTDIPMESLTNPPTPGSGMQVESTDLPKSESTTMLYEPSTPMPVHGDNITNNPEVTTMLCEEVSTNIKEHDETDMTIKDLMILCHLFFLPSDHGKIGIDLLEDFYWLKRNATKMLPADLCQFTGNPGAGSAEERAGWEQRATKFKQTVTEIQTLFVKLCSCQNRELVYDLYTYLWDMCGVVQTMEGFVQWMSKGACSPKLLDYVVGQQTWFSGIREAFLSGDHEPWMFRGGLISDLQRLLPLDSGQDLYSYKFPEVPAPLLYYVRPFQPKDEADIYKLAATAYEDSIDAPMGLCEADKILVGDKFVGAYLTLCPEYTFVCESSLDGSIVAYICIAPDAKTFYNRHNMAWLPEMRLKYPMKGDKGMDEDMLTPIEQIAQSFHNQNAEYLMSDCITALNTPNEVQVWAVGHMNVVPTLNEASVTKRLTMLSLACLRASGCIRMFVELASHEVPKKRDFYVNLGFAPVVQTEPKANDQRVFMTRSF